jgi:hypothetical protein
MRKMLSATLLICTAALLPTLLIVAVHATPPEAVSGYFDYTFEVTGSREADGNVFIYAKEWEVWVGSFKGTAESVFRVEMFSAGFWNVWLRSTFAGWVNGEYGELTIQLVGKKPAAGDWYGQWVILSGTGDLANLHGHGTWWGPGFGAAGPDIFYAGNMHFN